MLLFSLIWLLLAGLPFLLTGLKVETDWIYSRFTIPYILGSALLIASLLASIPTRPWIPVVLVSLLVGLSVGNQFLNSNRFRNDWESQKNLYWQFAWRAPFLQEGTTLVINEQNSYSGSATYLTAAMNWLYAPDYAGPDMRYQVVFARHSIDNLLDPATNRTRYDYLGGVFTGSSKDIVSLFYNGRCLIVLDPQIDTDNPTLDEYSARSAALSDPERILASGTGNSIQIEKDFFGSEPARNWCYWYAQADLARWRGDWAEVVKIGDQYLNDENLAYKTVSTYLPFIEGYAHLNRWELSLALSEQINQLVADNRRELDGVDGTAMLCRLWERMERQTQPSAQKSAALSAFNSKFSCTP